MSAEAWGEEGDEQKDGENPPEAALFLTLPPLGQPSVLVGAPQSSTTLNVYWKTLI